MEGGEEAPLHELVDAALHMACSFYLESEKTNKSGNGMFHRSFPEGHGLIQSACPGAVRRRGVNGLTMKLPGRKPPPNAFEKKWKKIRPEHKGIHGIPNYNTTTMMRAESSVRKRRSPDGQACDHH